MYSENILAMLGPMNVKFNFLIIVVPLKNVILFCSFFTLIYICRQ